MNFQDWFFSTLSTSAVSTLLVAGLAWLLRNLITNRLKASVQHEFDEKLETLRAELRKSEEAFKADLRAKEAQIETLRSGALTVLASRQAAIDKRRLDAIEQLWAGIETLGPQKWAVSIMATVKFEKSLELASQELRVRKFFETVGANIDPQKFQKVDVHKARPFVSEIAWALFSAYQAILGHAVAQLMMLRTGLNEPKILDHEHVLKLVRLALPEHGDYVKRFGISGCFQLLEPLETKLLKEFQHMMRGEESGKTTIEQAAKILEEANRVNKGISGDPV